MDEKIERQREADRKRYIYILLVRYPDMSSRLFRFITRGCYSHASIGISNTDGIFYSYVTTGFRKELPRQHPTFKQREIPCRLYRMEISDEIHDVAKAVLDDHAKQSHKFKYNTLGVILCLFRIVYMRKHRYFCSQFVSEILGQIRAVPLAKHSSLYLPDDFMNMKELDFCFSGYLSQLVSLPEPMTYLTA